MEATTLTAHYPAVPPEKHPHHVIVPRGLPGRTSFAFLIWKPDKEPLMILAIVDFEVAAADRDAALAIVANDVTAAMARPGNLSFRAFTNAGSDTHVGLMHEWKTLDDFQAYLASSDFAAIGQALRPMMTAPPVSRRFRVELIEDKPA